MKKLAKYKFNKISKLMCLLNVSKHVRLHYFEPLHSGICFGNN